MQVFARIQGDIVAELLRLPDGAVLAECHHPAIVTACVPVPAGATVAEGDSYTAGSFGPPPRLVRTPEDARLHRAALLAACDWRVGTDTPLPPEQVAAWIAYRAALRAWPEQPGWPDAPLPTPPG